MPADLGDELTVSQKLVRNWENAYRNYGAASATAGRLQSVDPATATKMASASKAVAAAWRRLASGSELPWWALAAVQSAAEAFDDQARRWEGRSDEDEGRD